jgi:hypothetical protein
MNRFQKDIVFFKEEKYRELNYGTIFFVPGTRSSSLNEFVRLNADKIETDINADENNWVTCRIMFLEQDNNLFTSEKQATLFSAMLPTDNQEDNKWAFIREALDNCEPEEIESTIKEYFETAQKLFDEILDTGYYHIQNWRPLKEKRMMKSCPSPFGAQPRLQKSAKFMAEECECAPIYDTPSRLEITPFTYHVLLPDYEREIHFTAQVKALYVLFLNHPEGIRMKEIADYKEEYKQLYFQLTNRSDTDKLRGSVERLLDVYNPNSLNVKKSQCNAAIYTAIPEDSLRHYYEIEVNRGQPHKINLDRTLVHMPIDLQKQSL